MVEEFLQLRLGRILPVPLLALVFVVQVGFGGSAPHCDLPDLHVDDFHCVRIDVRNSWVLILFLVYQNNLWSCQG